VTVACRGFKKRDARLGVESEEGHGEEVETGLQRIKWAIRAAVLGVAGGGRIRPGCYGFGAMSPFSVRIVSSILRIRVSSTALECMMCLTLP